ncbi:MAG: hypothetical protein AABX00_01080 [Nanoarchaeota archaeon]
MSELGIRLEEMLKKSDRWVHAVVPNEEYFDFNQARRQRVVASSDGKYPHGSAFHTQTREGAWDNGYSILITSEGQLENIGHIVAYKKPIPDDTSQDQVEHGFQRYPVVAESSDAQLLAGRELYDLMINKLIGKGYSLLLLNYELPGHSAPTEAKPAPRRPIWALFTR